MVDDSQKQIGIECHRWELSLGDGWDWSLGVIFQLQLSLEVFRKVVIASK